MRVQSTEEVIDHIDAVTTVIVEAQGLRVQDVEKEQLIQTLRPIADNIPAVIEFTERTIAKKCHSKADAAEILKARDKMLADDTEAETALREFSGGLIDRLHKAHRGFTSMISKFKVLSECAKKCKRVVTDWEDDEARKAAEEQRKKQAAADAEAETKRLALLAKAERLKTPEKKAAAIEQAAAVAAPVIKVEAPKSGVSSSLRWAVKSYDMNAMGIPLPVQGYITVETNRLVRAKAANTMLEVPGVVFHQVRV